jgi:hypothetical protein
MLGHVTRPAGDHGTAVLALALDLEVRVVDAAAGELLRSLIVDPAKDDQPAGEPPGPKRRPMSKK